MIYASLLIFSVVFMPDFHGRLLICSNIMTFPSPAGCRVSDLYFYNYRSTARWKVYGSMGSGMLKLARRLAACPCQWFGTCMANTLLDNIDHLSTMVTVSFMCTSSDIIRIKNQNSVK